MDITSYPVLPTILFVILNKDPTERDSHTSGYVLIHGTPESFIGAEGSIHISSFMSSVSLSISRLTSDRISSDGLGGTYLKNILVNGISNPTFAFL